MRLFRLPGGDAARAPFDPPAMAVSARAVRVLRAGDALVTHAVTASDEELWYGEPRGVALRARLDGDRHLEVRVRAEGIDETRRLLRIPLGERGTEGRRRYYGRWEHAKDRAVLSPKGAGVILDGETSLTVAGEPSVVDVIRGEGLLLGLALVPNGARVLDAVGIEGLEAGAVISEIRVPEVERGPKVEVHPIEAALCGFAPIGFRGSFGGLPFAGFARALGDGSGDLARFLKRPGAAARGAVRPHAAPPDDRDAHLEAALERELAPRHTLGRVRVGAPGTIGLSDGRSYRVRAAALERLPKGRTEIVVAALLPAGDGALELRVARATEGLVEPTPEAALEHARELLIDFVPWLADDDGQPGRP